MAPAKAPWILSTSLSIRGSSLSSSPDATRLDATSLGEASRDFNVLARRGRARASTGVLREAARAEAATAGVLYAARGAWAASSDAEAFTLTADSGVRWCGEPVAWAVEQH